MWYQRKHDHGLGVALAMRHRHSGLSTCGLNGLRQGYEHPTGPGTLYFLRVLCDNFDNHYMFEHCQT